MMASGAQLHKLCAKTLLSGGRVADGMEENPTIDMRMTSHENYFSIFKPSAMKHTWALIQYKDVVLLVKEIQLRW